MPEPTAVPLMNMDEFREAYILPAMKEWTKQDESLLSEMFYQPNTPEPSAVKREESQCPPKIPTS